MTYQEAIKQLEDLIENSKSFSEYDDDIWANDVKALETAIEALEKQIPKKPLDRRDSADISIGHCPNCNCFVDDWNDDKCCGGCGQIMDWEDAE